MGDEPPTHAEAPDLAALRLLEVGDRCVFKRAMPDRTELLWTGARHWPEAGLAHRSFGPGGIAPLRQALQGGVDLVICHAPHYAPLQDKPRLARIAAARAHVLRHHTQAALCAHVLLSCLAPAEDSR